MSTNPVVEKTFHIFGTVVERSDGTSTVTIQTRPGENPSPAAIDALIGAASTLALQKLQERPCDCCECRAVRERATAVSALFDADRYVPDGARLQ